MVNKHTLIPRDETEVLMHHIRDFERDFVPRKLLDVGTGSGCIALALQRIFLDIRCSELDLDAATDDKNNTVSITAIDICAAALRMARNNEKNNLFTPVILKSLEASAIKINWVHSNLLQKILLGSAFDMIVANLPYVPAEIDVSREVEREPSTAIFSGGDGLFHIRRLAQELQTKKICFKELWLEFLPEQERAIADIFSRYQVKFLTDVGGDVYFAVVLGTVES
jgi:release factor glutamine methyltransferase